MFKRFIFAAVTMLSLPSAALAAEAIGSVVAVVGQPTASTEGKIRNLAEGDEVFVSDRITVAKGNAQLKLRDGTKLVVGPDSTLLLDKFVMQGDKKAKLVSIKALRGSYRFFSGQSAKSAYNITTSSATIGIRGTIFDFWVQKKTGAVVFKGAVDLGGLQAGVVRVNEGCFMGEATPTAARLLSGDEKAKTIRKNLPLISDQSQLQKQFQVNTDPCKL
jgi:hypothetical protein